MTKTITYTSQLNTRSLQDSGTSSDKSQAQKGQIHCTQPSNITVQAGMATTTTVAGMSAAMATLTLANTTAPTGKLATFISRPCAGGGGGNPPWGGPPGGGGNGKLGGNPPSEFDGDQSKANTFRNQFDLYRITNIDAEQMTNPMKRTALFLGFLKGPKVKDWVRKWTNWIVEQ